MTEGAPVRPLTAALIDASGLPLGSDVARAVSGYADELAKMARQRLTSGGLRLTDHDVRMAMTSRVEDPRPFAWSTVTARRGLGLLAVRALVAGEARTPT